LDGGNLKLIVVTPYFWSEVGIGNAVRELTKAMVKIGVELVAIVHADPHAKNVHPPVDEERHFSIDLKGNWLLKKPLFKNIILSRAAAKMLKCVQKDYGNCVIHSNNLFPSYFLENSLEKASFVTTIHGTAEGEIERHWKELPLHPRELTYRLGYFAPRYMNRIFMKHSRDNFIVMSQSNACEIMRRGVPRSQVHIIPNGVNIDFFKPYDRNESRKQLKLPTEKRIALTINAIELRKGLHTLIRAAHIVVDNQPDAYFVVVGKTVPGQEWYLTYLRKLVHKLGLERHFKFTGRVPTGELPLYYGAADVFTSSSYAEAGSPLVVKQAMACGRMVIVTQGAAASYLPPELVVPNGNFNDFAQKLSFYLSHEKENRSASKQLYQIALDELSWANIAKKTLDLYREIITNNPA
jgi:glycosyltransferase involved in cell wall biosynthesis